MTMKILQANRLRLPSGGRFGRRGLPDEIVNQMWADYLRLKSVEKVGDLWNRSRQSIWEMFKTRGLPVNKKNIRECLVYRGQTYYRSGHGGYFRPGVGPRRVHLHRVIWEEHHGRAVPSGYCIEFSDGNQLNFKPSNLVLNRVKDHLRETQARSILKKSRAMTALLLDRSQKKHPDGHIRTVSTLRGER